MKAAKLFDSKEAKVRTFADVSELVSEVAQIYSVQGTEKGHKGMLEILGSQIWRSFSGLESAEDLLTCSEMVRGLDVSAYWLLHLCGAFPFYSRTIMVHAANCYSIRAHEGR